RPPGDRVCARTAAEAGPLATGTTAAHARRRSTGIAAVTRVARRVPRRRARKSGARLPPRLPGPARGRHQLRRLRRQARTAGTTGRGRPYPPRSPRPALVSPRRDGRETPRVGGPRSRALAAVSAGGPRRRDGLRARAAGLLALRPGRVPAPGRFPLGGLSVL